MAPTADHLGAHAFQCHPLHGKARQSDDRGRIACVGDFDVAEHDVAQETGPGRRLAAAARATPDGERASGVANADPFQGDVFHVRAVDGLDRHTARLVQPVELGHAFVTTLSGPRVEVAVLHAYPSHRAARLRTDLEAVRPGARTAAHDLDVLTRSGSAQEQARLHANRVVVALHVAVCDAHTTARVRIDAVGERVADRDPLHDDSVARTETHAIVR